MLYLKYPVDHPDFFLDSVKMADDEIHFSFLLLFLLLHKDVFCPYFFWSGLQFTFNICLIKSKLVQRWSKGLSDLKARLDFSYHHSWILWKFEFQCPFLLNNMLLRTIKEPLKKVCKLLQALYYKTGLFKYIAMYLNDRYA